MKNLFKLPAKYLVTAGAATVMMLTTGCGGSSDSSSSGTSVITADNAVSFAITMMSFNDFGTSVTSGKGVTPGTKASTDKAIINDVCSVSGSYSYDTVTDTWTFNNCNDGFGVTNGTTTYTTVGTVDTYASDITYSFSSTMFVMQLTSTHDTSDGAYSFDIDLSYTFPQGTLTVVTNPAFMGVDPSPPTTGSMLITGPYGGKILATAYPGYMRVQADTDGNGSYDFDTTVDWTSAGF